MAMWDRAERVLALSLAILGSGALLAVTLGSLPSALVLLVGYGTVSMVACALSSIAWTAASGRRWTSMQRAASIATAVIANIVIVSVWRAYVAPEQVRTRTGELWLGPLLVSGALMPMFGQLVAPVGGLRGLVRDGAITTMVAVAVVWWLVPR